MLAVDGLKRVPQSWTIQLVHDIGSHAYSVVRIYAEDVSVVGRMVEFAHSDPVSHDGLAALRVSQHMSRVKQSYVTELTDGAAVLIGEQDALPKHSLVESLLHHAFGIGPYQQWVHVLKISA